MFGHLEAAAVHGAQARALIERALEEIDELPQIDRNLSQH